MTVRVDITVDDDLAVTCSKDPIVIDNEEDIVFALKSVGPGHKPKDLQFVGFLSPQDLRHREFQVGPITRNKGISEMTVHDKHIRKDTFRYELLFCKTDAPKDLYNYDPQIKNR